MTQNNATASDSAAPKSLSGGSSAFRSTEVVVRNCFGTVEFVTHWNRQKVTLELHSSVGAYYLNMHGPWSIKLELENIGLASALATHYLVIGFGPGFQTVLVFDQTDVRDHWLAMIMSRYMLMDFTQSAAVGQARGVGHTYLGPLLALPLELDGGSATGSEIIVQTIPCAADADNCNFELDAGQATVRFKVDSDPAALELCTLSSCHRYLCLIADDSLTVYDRGCTISRSDARIRMHCSVAGSSIGCIEVRGIGDDFWVYVGVGSELQLFEPDVQSVLQQAGTRSIVHDHTCGAVDAAADSEVIHDHSRDLSVTVCMAPTIVVIPNTVVSVAGNAGSIRCTGGGHTMVLEMPDRVISAAAISPNGQGLVFMQWDEHTQQSVCCYHRMPVSVQDFTDRDSERRIALSLNDCLSWPCCDSRVTTINYSGCGSHMLVGSEMGDVISFHNPQTSWGEEAEKNSWAGIKAEMKPGWVCKSATDSSAGTDRVVCCGFSFDNSTVWWMHGEHQLSIGCRKGATTLPVQAAAPSSAPSTAPAQISPQKYMELQNSLSNQGVSADNHSYDDLAVHQRVRMAVCFAAARGDALLLSKVQPFDLHFAMLPTKLSRGRTALHWAASHGQLHVVEILLTKCWAQAKKKPSKFVSGSNLKSSLGSFDRFGNVPIELGIDTLKAGQTKFNLQLLGRILWEAARLGDLQFVRSKQVIKAAAPTLDERELHQACLDWTNVQYHNRSALHVASEALSLGCVGMLLREGAYPASFDANFQAPLSLIFSAPSFALQRRRVSDEYFRFVDCPGILLAPDRNGQHSVLKAVQNGVPIEPSSEVKRMQIHDLPLSIQEEEASKSEPLTRNDQISLLQRVGMASADEDSIIPRDARLGVGLAAHLVDVVLDITLAIQLSEQGEMGYCYGTVVLILLAPFVQCGWDVWTMSPFRENKYRILKSIFLNLTLLRMSKMIVHLWVFVPSRLSTVELSSMRLFECMLKTLPQLILQCYILSEQTEEEATLIRILSILSGIFSVASVFAMDFHSFPRLGMSPQALTKMPPYDRWSRMCSQWLIFDNTLTEYFLLVAVRIGECGVGVIAIVMLIAGGNWLLVGCLLGGFYLLSVITYFFVHYESAIWSPAKSKDFAARDPPQESEGLSQLFFSAFVSSFFQMFAVIEDFEPSSNIPADTRIYSTRHFIEAMRVTLTEGLETSGKEALAAAQELVQRVHPNFMCNRSFMEGRSHIFNYEAYNRAAKRREASDQVLPMNPCSARLLPIARKLVDQLTALHGTPVPDAYVASYYAAEESDMNPTDEVFATLDQLKAVLDELEDVNQEALDVSDSSATHWSGDPFCSTRRLAIVIKSLMLTSRNWGMIIYSWHVYDAIHYQTATMIAAGGLTVLSYVSIVWLYYSRRLNAWDRSMWEYFSNLYLPSNHLSAHTVDPLILDGAYPDSTVPCWSGVPISTRSYAELTVLTKKTSEELGQVALCKPGGYLSTTSLKEDQFKIRSSEQTLVYRPFTHCDWTDWRAPETLENVAMRLNFCLEQADVSGSNVDQLSRGWIGVIDRFSTWARCSSVKSRRSSRQLVACSINLDISVRWLEDIASANLSEASIRKMIGNCLEHVTHCRDWLEPQVETPAPSSKELHLVADSLYRTLCLIHATCEDQALRAFMEGEHISSSNGEDKDVALGEVLAMVEGCLGTCLVDLDTVLRWYALHQIYEVGVKLQSIEQPQSSISPGAVQINLLSCDLPEGLPQQVLNLHRRFPTVNMAEIKQVFEECDEHAGHAARALRNKGEHDIASQNAPIKDSAKLISECVRGLWAEDLQAGDPETGDNKLYAPSPFLLHALDAVDSVLKLATADPSSLLSLELEQVSKLLEQLRLDLKGSHDRTFTHFYFIPEAPEHTPARKAVGELSVKLSNAFSALNVPSHLIAKWRGLTALESSHRPTQSSCDRLSEIKLLMDSVKIPLPWHPKPEQPCSCCFEKDKSDNKRMTKCLKKNIANLAKVKSKETTDSNHPQLIFELAKRRRPFEVMHSTAIDLLNMAAMCQFLACRMKPEETISGVLHRSDQDIRNITFSDESKQRREDYRVAGKVMKQCSTMLELEANDLGGVNFSSNEILYWCTRQQIRSTFAAEQGLKVFLETIGKHHPDPSSRAIYSQLNIAKLTAAALNQRSKQLIQQFMTIPRIESSTFKTNMAKLRYIKAHSAFKADVGHQSNQTDKLQQGYTKLNLLGMEMT